GLCGKATEDSARWRVEKHATVSAQREDADLVSVTDSPAAVSAVHAAVRRLRPAQGPSPCQLWQDLFVSSVTGGRRVQTERHWLTYYDQRWSNQLKLWSISISTGDQRAWCDAGLAEL